MAQLEEMREKYKEIAKFAYVYIKEAHPEDGWQSESNIKQSVVFKQPQTFAKRMQLAETFVEKMDVKATTLVDDIQNTASACYAAWPERIYIIDINGRIVYKGGMGPFYFKPKDVESFLMKHDSERRQEMSSKDL